jgi:catechol 2,3-dioxygenase-like lactoylglutathione lyase family enzyme
MIQVNGIDHIVLHVRDVERAKKFYTELLGMTAYRKDMDDEGTDVHLLVHGGWTSVVGLADVGLNWG